MKLKISFKHLDHTPALDERIKDKSEKLEKYFEGNLKVEWTCWVHEDKHWADVKVHGPKFDFFAKASADNMYKSLDLVIEKIERQMDKQKELMKDKLHHDRHLLPKHQEIKKRIQDEEKYAQDLLDEQSA